MIFFLGAASAASVIAYLLVLCGKKAPSVASESCYVAWPCHGRAGGRMSPDGFWDCVEKGKQVVRTADSRALADVIAEMPGGLRPVAVELWTIDALKCNNHEILGYLRELVTGQRDDVEKIANDDSYSAAYREAVRVWRDHQV